MRNPSIYYPGVIKQFFSLAFVLLFSFVALSQQRTITGKVTGPDSNPLNKVTVTVKGTKVATITKEDGGYSITLPPNANVLVFTYVGFQVDEVNIEGN
ncbi:MAG: carboxypeptidase-like regulatory domain-containing protein, partial [Chitinophagales bacterium]